MLVPLLQRYENHLVLDAGGWSMRRGTQRSLSTEVHLEGMRQLGLQVANVAGRDLALGPEALQKFEDDLDLQFISANVYSGGKLRFPPYLLLQKKLEGRVVRIGITGVTSGSQQAVEAWLDDSGLEFTDPLDAARQMLEALRPQTDVRILLAHLPLATLEDFARDEALGYDLLITSTGEFRETIPVGATPAVLAPGTQSKHLAWVYLRHLRPGVNEISGGEVLALDAKIADDPTMSRRVAEFKERLGMARAEAPRGPSGDPAADAAPAEASASSRPGP